MADSTLIMLNSISIIMIGLSVIMHAIGGHRG